MALRERSHLAILILKVVPAPTVTVPLLSGDVHDVNGLHLVATPSSLHPHPRRERHEPCPL